MAQGDNQSEPLASAFECIDGGFPLLHSTDVKQKLVQWNLDGSLQIRRFRVLRKITAEAEEELVRAFFRDSRVHAHLQLPADLQRRWESDSKQTPLRVQRLRATVTSLAFFDKLKHARLVAESGALRRCVDDVFEGATASDLVKESLVNPETEHGDAFSEQDQREFILHLFRALVIGGSMSQSDEWLAPYEDMAKRMYKALLSVKKNATDRTAIDVTSRVYHVDDAVVFDSPSRFSSCFVVVDAQKRWLTVWHNTFRPFW